MTSTPDTLTLLWEIPKVVPKSEDEDPNCKLILQCDFATRGKEWKEISYRSIGEEKGKCKAEVKNLSHGTKYKFRLIASNKYGHSLPSVSISARTVGVPKQPDPLFITDVTPTSATLLWKSVEKSSEPLTFIIERDSVNKSGEWKFEPVKVPVEKTERGYEAHVTDLTPGINYQFRLIAVNKQGQSDPSKASPVKPSDGIPGKPIKLKMNKQTDTTIDMQWKEAPSDKYLNGGNPSFIVELKEMNNGEFHSVNGKIELVNDKHLLTLT